MVMFRRVASAFSVLASLGSFAAASLISAAGPLLVIPAISRVGGVAGWTSIAIGQSVGLLASIVVVWGWAVHGPILAGRAQGEADIRRLAFESSSIRIGLLALVVVPASSISWGMSDPHGFLSALTAIGMASSGLTFSWFFVGVRQPLKLILLDSLPRLLASIFSFGAVLYWQNLLLYPLILILTNFGVFVLNLRVISGSWGIPIGYLSSRTLVRIFSRTVHVGSSQLASAVYINGAVLLVAMASAEAVAEFSAANRIYLASVTASVPLFQFFSGWVVHEHRRFRRRVVLAVVCQGLVGLGCIPLVYYLFPWITNFLFSGQVDVTSTVAALSAVSVGIVVVSRAIGSHVLLATGMTRTLAYSAFVGCAVALIFLPVGSWFFGAVGGSVALVMTELTVLVFQCVSKLLGRIEEAPHVGVAAYRSSNG